MFPRCCSFDNYSTVAHVIIFNDLCYGLWGVGLVCDVDRARAGPGWDLGLGPGPTIPIYTLSYGTIPYHTLLSTYHKR